MTPKKDDKQRRLEKIAERCEYALRGPVRSHDYYERLFREILKVARGE